MLEPTFKITIDIIYINQYYILIVYTLLMLVLISNVLITINACLDKYIK